jgi:CubicO group peptidase (beta-lactamase class C family)
MEPLRATPSELPVETVFSIYSITKTLIAIDVLRLAATETVAANDATASRVTSLWLR